MVKRFYFTLDPADERWHSTGRGQVRDKVITHKGRGKQDTFEHALFNPQEKAFPEGWSLDNDEDTVLYRSFALC